MVGCGLVKLLKLLVLFDKILKTRSCKLIIYLNNTYSQIIKQKGIDNSSVATANTLSLP